MTSHTRASHSYKPHARSHHEPALHGGSHAHHMKMAHHHIKEAVKAAKHHGKHSSKSHSR